MTAKPPRHEAPDPHRGARVSRGGAKLEAALESFGMAAAVRGARAIDVGASTGGFTEALLEHGASAVTAIDAGRDQLHPRLRADPRVTSLERSNLKTLALRIAPGPFDVFTVDVSFVAARTMLRGLAFRLRPGARGVVLLKPQFELPAHRVKAGDVSDPGLRAAALARFTERAQDLGFRVLEAIDSPVVGGSGTVEQLLHVEFTGRSERLPLPGERISAAAPAAPVPSPRAAAEVAFEARSHRWFAAAAPGIEAVVARELARVEGASEIVAVPGGVDFAGSLEAGLRANLALRAASRVLLRLGEVEATQFSLLRRRAGGLPWEQVVPPGVELEVSATTSHCRLHHSGALAETIELAVRDRLARRGRAGSEPARPAVAAGDDEPARAAILVRGSDDRFVLSADASGALLHRRGWRVESGRAPLRETLAAALLELCEWDPATPLVDPMCGAGTLSIEAAAIGLDRAPGLARPFACETWPAFAPERAIRVREALRATARAELRAPIFASDASEDAVAAARRNAERAGVAPLLRFAVTPLAELRAPRKTGRGLVLVNPPWGRRLLDPRRARQSYAELGHVLRERFERWRAGIVVADPRHADVLRMKPSAVHRITSGGVRARLLVFEVGKDAAARRARAG